MLKILFARLVQRGLVAIAICGLLLSTAACNSATPEELPQLESVTERLEKQSKTNRSASSTDSAPELIDAPSVEAIGAAVNDLGEDLGGAAPAVTPEQDTTAEAMQDAQETTAAIKDAAQTTSDEMQQQLQAEKDTIQKKLEAANAEAAQALEAELQRASEAFNEELTKAKSKLQPVSAADADTDADADADAGSEPAVVPDAATATETAPTGS